MAVIALSVRMKLGAPIVFRQIRPGRDGRPFVIYKFRTMIDSRDSVGQLLPDAQRLTRFGRFLRSTSLDELPEFLNVLSGNMSVVGPRPERPVFVEELSRQVPLYYYRHGVRPGLTGWAQLNFPYGASVADAREKLQYDLYYIKNASLILDLLILLQTAEVVVWGRGTSMSGAAPGEERRGRPASDQPNA